MEHRHAANDYNTNPTRDDIEEARVDVRQIFPSARLWREPGQASRYQIEDDGRILGASDTSGGEAWCNAAQNIMLRG